jgi:hypothetical protein
VEKSHPTGFDLRTVQPVASRYTDCAILYSHKLSKYGRYVIGRYCANRLPRNVRSKQKMQISGKSEIWVVLHEDIYVCARACSFTRGMLERT